MTQIGNIEIGKKPVIVASIKSMDEAETAENMGADIIELRIDLCKDIDVSDATPFVQQLREKIKLPVIATNRMREEGGSYRGTEQQRISVLESVMPLVDAVDIELKVEGRQEVIDKAREESATIITSYHDFHGTPPREEIESTINEMIGAGSDICKIAVTPQSPADVLMLLDILLQHTEVPITMIGMGTLGKHMRVIAPLYSSVLSYGCVNEAVAPGQIRIDDMRRVLDLLAF